MADIWIITAPAPLDKERAVYHVAALMRDAFPEYFLDFHVLNPRNFEEPFDVHELLPPGLERVELPGL